MFCAWRRRYEKRSYGEIRARSGVASVIFHFYGSGCRVGSLGVFGGVMNVVAGPEFFEARGVLLSAGELKKIKLKLWDAGRGRECVCIFGCAFFILRLR